MTLPLPFQIEHSDTQANFDEIAQKFPINAEQNVPVLAAAFTTWKTIGWAGASVPNSGAGTVLMYGVPSQTSANAPIAVGAVNSGSLAFYLDPADWTANLRSTKLRIRWVLITNATASTVNFTPGLYPIGSFGGAAGAQPTIATIGSVVAGSTALFTAPAGNSATITTSSEFAAPNAGHFVFGLSISGLMAVNSTCTVTGQLQMRQV